MTRRNFLFVLTVIAFLANATWAQVPDKQKVVASAERAFEKFTKAYVGPGPGCAAAVSLNGETVFEKAFRLADLEHNVPNTAAAQTSTVRDAHDKKINHHRVFVCVAVCCLPAFTRDSE